MAGTPAVRLVGSPPRRRGRRRWCGGRGGYRGLTPAQAGTAGCSPTRVRRRWAHPRAGGDGGPWVMTRPPDPGSPPRRRGRRHRVLRPAERHGLTPAQAGTAFRVRCQPCQVCGSPPRRRGRRSRCRCGRSCLGLTPAQAGTAPTPPACSSATRAHPRAGGDGADKAASDLEREGSPPRRRGRRHGPRRHRQGRGLTPAQAGTARRGSAGGRSRWAHPRAGGDGQQHRLPRVLDDGLTPAQAGTAWPSRCATGPHRAHPRAGGDGRNAGPAAAS